MSKKEAYIKIAEMGSAEAMAEKLSMRELRDLYCAIAYTTPQSCFMKDKLTLAKQLWSFFDMRFRKYAV